MSDTIGRVHGRTKAQSAGAARNGPAKGGTYDRAMRVGARMFAGEGYEATTTRELSRGLGITNGTFYHYFANKEGLLLQICEESLVRITEASSLAVQAEPDVRAKLRALIGAHVHTMLGDQDLHKTMLLEIRALNGHNRAKVISMRNAYSALIRQVLEACQKEGVLRRDISAQLLTLLLLNLMNWTIIWFSQIGPLTPADLAMVIEKLFVEGAAKR